MAGSPIHVTLECDVCNPANRRKNWWDCPNEKFAALMRAHGVRGNSVFNVNGGFFVIHRDAIDTAYTLASEFWHACKTEGFVFNDEPLLAYVAQMLCGNPYEHTLRATADVWASDWTGFFADRLPDGQPWWFTDYFTEETFPVNPSIVHAMRSKKAFVTNATG